MVYAEFGSDEVMLRDLKGRMVRFQARKLLDPRQESVRRLEYGQSLSCLLQGDKPA
jgi:hypothetical protein